MPSESVLHIISREEEEPENTVITSNSTALGDGMLSDATSLQRSGLDQHQILSRKVCLWIIHLHDNLEWIVNLAKAVIYHATNLLQNEPGNVLVVSISSYHPLGRGSY